MSGGSVRTTFALIAAGGMLALAAGSPSASPQSGTMVGKARAKVNQSQAAAASPEPAAPPQPPAAAPPAPAGETGSINPIAADPNHLSAVKALEQIRRDEENSSEGSSFSYEPGDRRDPFMSPHDVLQAQMSTQVCDGEGMECWLIQDVTVIGVLARRNGNVALVIGPDGYGTTLREGDRLYDGEVRHIDPEAGLVVFRQKINDPTRIKPFRDVEKGLNLNKEGRS
jgi:Tfp pilus assembly protein PilP